MYLPISVNIELMVGTDVKDAVKYAQEFAKRLDVAYACFDFNNVNVYVSQYCNINDVAEQIIETIKSDKKNKFVVA